MAVLILILTFVAGAIVAVGYLAGLWLSVQHVCRARQVTAGFAMTLILRLALVTAAFGAIGVGLVDGGGAGGGPVRLLVALAGFVTARAAILWRIRRCIEPARGTLGREPA